MSASREMIEGEMSLWVAVIVAAINDCIGPVTSNGTDYKYRELFTDQAKSWILSPNKDYNYVCMLAGLDPDWVRDMAKKVIERGTKFMIYSHIARDKRHLRTFKKKRV